MKTCKPSFPVISIFLLGWFTGGTITWAEGTRTAPIVKNVELIQVPVIVFDEKGAIAADLDKNDFRLTEDGVVQQILYLDRERIPVSFTIIADLSASMKNKIAFVQDAAISLLDPTNQDRQGQNRQLGDEYAVVGVGSRARELVAFTRDQDDLTQRLPGLLTDTGERTALFDGVYLGVTIARRESAYRRRAMIVISDGDDNHSRYSLREIKKLLEEADVPVYAIMAGSGSYWEIPNIFAGIEKKRKEPATKGPGPPWRVPSLNSGVLGSDHIGSEERRGPYILHDLAEASGGGVFTAKTPEDISRIARTIGRAVRYQYVLSYKSLHQEGVEVGKLREPGKYVRHDIHLELYPKESFAGYSMPYYKRRYIAAE